MLELRGTSDTLAVGKGEDCLLTRPKGARVYRQAKTKHSRAWSLADQPLAEYIARSYARFQEDASIRHEFYTDATIVPAAFVTRGHTKTLNPEARQLLFADEASREAFCSHFTFQDKYVQGTEQSSRLDLKGKMRDILSSEYPDTLAFDLVTESEWESALTRLIEAETRLFLPGVEIQWDEVESAVGLEKLIQIVSIRSRAGGSLLPYDQATTLSENTRDAIAAIESHRILPRPPVDELLGLVSDWSKGTPMAAILVLAAHGTGKTWALIQTADRLSKEMPQLSVCFAAGPPPDRAVELEGINAAEPKPCVAFIDDLIESDWHSVLALSRRLQKGRILFICSAALETNAPEVEELERIFGIEQLKRVFLPASLTPSEVHSLADVLRKFPPAATETARIAKTNIRFAAAILRGEDVPPHVGKLKRLCSDRMELLHSLGPLLVCAELDVMLPSSLLAKAIGHAIPDDLKPWLITSRRQDLTVLTFEDAVEARLLLTELFDAAVDEARYSHLENLVGQCDPLNPIERIFCRQLFQRSAKRNDALADRLLRSSKRLIEQLLPIEPLWAITYCWMPTINVIKDDNLRGHLAGLITNSDRAKEAESIAELMLWMDIYADTATSKYSSLRAKSDLLSWDADRIARLARIVRRLPSAEQRPVARKFCGLFRRLPEELVHQCLLLQNTFSLLAAMLADHGGPVDREIGLRQFGTTLVFQRKSSLRIAGAWTESYAKLVDRTFRQSRNGLSSHITRELLAHAKFDPRADYDDCRAREQGRAVHPLLEEWFNIFASLSDDTAGDERTVLIAANALSSAAMWAETRDWTRLIEQYLVTLKSLADRGVPIGRISPLIMPAFHAFSRRADPGQSKRLLEILFLWVPHQKTKATEETTKFMFKLYAFTSEQDWLGKAFVELARELLTAQVLNAERAQLLGKEFCRQLSQERQGASFEPHPSAGIMQGWTDHLGITSVYLSSVSRLSLNSAEQERVCVRIAGLWASRVNATVSLCGALLRMMHLQLARPLVEDMLMRDADRADVHALAGILAALEKDIPRAYQHVARIVEVFRKQQTGARLPLHGWLHSQLASITPKSKAMLHRLCAELVSDRRLREYDDVIKVQQSPPPDALTQAD